MRWKKKSFHSGCFFLCQLGNVLSATLHKSTIFSWIQPQAKEYLCKIKKKKNLFVRLCLDVYAQQIAIVVN